ncbi:MAG: adenylyl-sulfate kinase [Crocinitomicaceae bacterium]|jgi:adenylylsulfate kinase|nr:adenylyl-sulfate kinase [Crocinitomicaceae bacterium]MBK6950851.1 adenylyl-sulfate kinase [Crocinitomicaceae bacterium]
MSTRTDSANRKLKEKILNQRGMVIWFTGLSGAGKTTLAHALKEELEKKNYFIQLLDGDDLRKGINSNLGFSEADRFENIRRTAEIAKLFVNSGIVTICSFISPTNEIRKSTKEIIGSENYFEIYVNTSLKVCEERDVKGMYKKARAGEIKNFTGIDSVFEIPADSNMEINTENLGVSESVDSILKKILPHISF